MNLGLLNSLKQILSPDQIANDPESLDKYGRDWTAHYLPDPCVVVFPKKTEDVKSIVSWARRKKIALVPSGGRTGLSAAAFATNKECVVSFEKMNQILNFDPVDQIVTCQAGVVTEALQNYAKSKSLFFPIDFASKGSSQIGGNIATNAGGVKVIHYGLMRNWVVGLKVVTGSGEIISLNNSLIKNSTGYDLRHLFIGSEGTLGFVVEAQIKLTRKPQDCKVLLLALPHLEAVMKVYQKYKMQFDLTAYEVFTHSALKYVLSAESSTITKSPLSEAPCYVLLELAADESQSLKCFESCMEEGLISDGVISETDKQAADLWAIRENISEALSVKKPYKNDVSVPISKVPMFLKDMEDLIQTHYPKYEVVYFGHIGDGNLHINTLKPDDLDSEKFTEDCKKQDELLFALVKKYKGSISAEHGVGLTKKDFLHNTKSAEEIRLMKEIKKIFDPDLIMNPGKIFDI